MVKKKGAGKQTKAPDVKGQDTGLQELQGSFRNGMLRVKGLQTKRR